MSNSAKSSRSAGSLESTIKDMPRISDQERTALRASLDRAKAEIAAGQFDEVTAESLRAEFNAIYYQGKADDEIDADLTRATADKL